MISNFWSILTATVVIEKVSFGTMLTVTVPMLPVFFLLPATCCAVQMVRELVGSKSGTVKLTWLKLFQV